MALSHPGASKAAILGAYHYGHAVMGKASALVSFSCRIGAEFSRGDPSGIKLISWFPSISQRGLTKTPYQAFDKDPSSKTQRVQETHPGKHQGVSPTPKLR